VRIAAFSNFYPPAAIGGYELGCRDVVDELVRRGHQVEVLTSSYQADQVATEQHVQRQLPYFAVDGGRGRGLVARAAAERLSYGVVREFLGRTRFDLVYVFGAFHVCRSIFLSAQATGTPMSYYVSDHWLERWRDDDDWLRWWSSPDHPRASWKRPLVRTLRRLGAMVPRRLLGQTRFEPLELGGVQFASAALKSAALAAGLPVSDAAVIPWGIVLDRFPRRDEPAGPATRLLYVGRMVRDKGVHTVLEAVIRLRAEAPELDYTLDLCGREDDDPAYARELRQRVSAAGLEESVRFRGWSARESLGATYRAHDVVVFPSIWEEPFGLVLVEAMASGVPVVSSATGGSAEITRNGVTGLHFPAGDAAACAAAIARLRSPDLTRSLRTAALADVAARFSIEAMVDSLERDFAARSPAAVVMRS